MTALALPFQIHIVYTNSGIKSNCRDANNALLVVPHSVKVSMTFDENKRSLVGGFVGIDLNGSASGEAAVVPPLVGPPHGIHLNCRVNSAGHPDGSVISTCTDSAGALVPGPHAVVVSMVFDANRNFIAGHSAIGSSLLPPVVEPPAETDLSGRLAFLEDAVLRLAILLAEDAEHDLSDIISQLEATLASRG